MSHPRSVPVKRRLVTMMEARFPAFKFSYDWKGFYGFVRENPGRLYDYLIIGRRFERFQAGWRGYLGVGPVCRGYNPDWDYWSTGDPWRRGIYTVENYEDILYQQDRTAFLDDALDQLAEKLERDILPLYTDFFSHPDIFPRPFAASDMVRWQLLAERLLPELEALAQSSPARWEELRKWVKAAAWNRAGEPPEEMARWLAEVRTLPGFREEYGQSPILQEDVFCWLIHAMFVHP